MYEHIRYQWLINILIRRLKKLEIIIIPKMYEEIRYQWLINIVIRNFKEIQDYQNSLNV